MEVKRNLFVMAKNFFREHKIFATLLIIESLILIVFGCFLSTRQNISVSIPTNISITKDTNSSEEENQEIIGISSIGLHLGGYETSVEYNFVPEDQFGETITSGGLISFTNNQNSEKIDGGDLDLTNLASEEHGRLYVKAGETINVTAQINKNGTLHIHNFTLKENIGYRFVLFLGLVLFMTLIDAICLIGFSKKIGSRSKKITGAVIIITIIASLPMFMNVLFGGHDIDFHLERIAALSSEISNGNMPVRMMADTVNEHTYPNPIFYCDIFLYLPALLYSMFVPLQVCYQIYCVIIGLVTCLIAFFCLKKITGNTRVSVVGSALYTLSTYRLVDLALRAAIGELTAMAFLPLIVLGVYSIYTTKKPTFRDWAPLGIGIGLVAMCHIITLELCLGIIALLCLVMIKNTFKKERIISLIKAALLCVGISLWFILPFADYTINQPVDVLGRGASGFHSESGVYPVQLLNLFDTAVSTGDVDSLNIGMQNEMSFGLGASILAGLVLVGWILFFNRKNKKIDKNKYNTILTLFVVGCIALFMSSYLFPWATLLSVMPEKISGIVASIQFPWRLISISTLAFVFAIAISLSCIECTTMRRRFNQICLVLVTLVAISSTQYLFSVPHTKDNYVVNFASTTSSLSIGTGEYLPAGAKKSTAYNKDVKVEEGKLEEIDYKKEGGSFVLSYKNSQNESAKVVLPIFAYRYMEATDDSGNKVNTSISDDKLISIELPPNSDGDITIKFEPPVLWHVAEVISIGAWLFCGFMYIHTRKKNNS